MAESRWIMCDRVVDGEAAIEAEPVVIDLTATAVQITLDDGVSVVFDRAELAGLLAVAESEAA